MKTTVININGVYMQASIITCRQDINKLQFKLNRLSLDDFNKVIDNCNKLANNGEMTRGYEETSSKGIRIKIGYRTKPPFFGVERSGNGFYGVVVQSYATYLVGYRIHCGELNKVDPKEMTGRKAFKAFNEALLEDGIDMSTHKLEKAQGKAIKAEIMSPKIDLAENVETNKSYYGACHIDINSAYPACMKKYRPEWANTIDRLYDKRKENSGYYKNVLNMTTGYFQSQYSSYGYADVAKYCINTTRALIEKMAAQLEAIGCKVLSYNTDGIWYVGKPLEEYLPENNTISGKGLGQWKTDHKNCKIRFKSKGAYEFIENGVYTPVIRGATVLDKYIPREDWQWGAIYGVHARITAKTYVNDKTSPEYGKVYEVLIEEFEGDLND